MGITYRLYWVAECSDTDGNALLGFVGTVAHCPDQCVHSCGPQSGVWVKNIYMYEILYFSHLKKSKNIVGKVDIPLVCECVLSNTDT